MSYPYVAAGDVPSVDYTTDKDGVHLVVFHATSPDGQRGRVVIPADVMLEVASRMCVSEIDTVWAKRHLESQGYRITKREPGSYGRLAGCVEWLQSMGH